MSWPTSLALTPATGRPEPGSEPTAEQWDADMGHDTLDRLPGITAPTLVISGRSDGLNPPEAGEEVAVHPDRTGLTGRHQLDA